MEGNLDQDDSDTNQITENETSATNSSSNDSSDESQESCGKCVVSSNRHDMDSSMRGNREATGGGMVKEENHQVVTEESSATKMKPPLNHSDIIDITVEPEDTGKIEVSSRVLVWWPYEKRYYSGTVHRIKVSSSDPDPHHILYDDGDREWTNLYHCDFKHIDAAAATSGGLNNSDTSASESAVSVSVSQSRVIGIKYLCLGSSYMQRVDFFFVVFANLPILPYLFYSVSFTDERNSPQIKIKGQKEKSQ